MVWLTRLLSLLTLLLAGLFWFSFDHLKHSPALSSLIPFANDPYDSIGSFAAILAIPLAVLATVRAFRSSGFVPMTGGSIRVARAQMAVVLAVSTAVAADLIAMARHPSMWLGKSGTNELIAYLAGMMVVATGVGIAVHWCARRVPPARAVSSWRRPTAAVTLFIAALALFPELVIKTLPGEVLALATGILLLFMVMAAFLVALIPGDARSNATSAVGASHRWWPWVATIATGLAIGACLVWMESHEEGGIAPGKLLVVAGLFLFAGALGLGTAYAFLKRPLGLFERN
ncbi:MAG: hypothetical protein WA825_17790 [Steroidobacteraceae bacterium]